MFWYFLECLFFGSTSPLMSPHSQLSASHWAEPNSRTLHIPLYCKAEPLNITETADLVIPFVSAPQNGPYYNIYRTYIGGVFRMMVVISASNLPCFLLSSLLYAVCVVIKKYLGQVVSFCLKSCTALVWCRWKVLQLLNKIGEYHLSFSSVREQNYWRMSWIWDSFYTCPAPLYTCHKAL